MRIAKGQRITDEDRAESAKFERFTKLAHEIGQQRAYQEVYGEVVYQAPEPT